MVLVSFAVKSLLDHSPIYCMVLSLLYTPSIPLATSTATTPVPKPTTGKKKKKGRHKGKLAGEIQRSSDPEIGKGETGSMQR